MTLTLEQWELYRDRWKRARRMAHLDDATSQEFGTGGLGRYAPDVHVRFLVLPGDPDGTLLQFDEISAGRRLALTSVNGRSTGDQVYGFVAGLYQRTLQRSQNRRVTRPREADDEVH